MKPPCIGITVAGATLALALIVFYKFKYHLKFIFYYGFIMIAAAFFIPIFLFKPGNVRNLVTASALFRHISTIISLRWILSGREHLEKDQACIIVSNHQSSIDILALFDLWPIMNKCTIVARKELFYFWPFGLSAWLAGITFIPRSDGNKARAIMNEVVERKRKDKIKLWVFPEGTRRNTGQIHPFKKGAFHLAISSKLPILPVVFSQYYFLDKENKRFDHGKVYITALPHISTENMTLDNVEELMEQTRNIMTATFHESNKEIKDSLRPFSSQ